MKNMFSSAYDAYLAIKFANVDTIAKLRVYIMSLRNKLKQ